MKKAVIIVHSKTGITRRYAEDMEEYLQNKGISTELLTIREYRDGVCAGADYLMLGCWTSGLMIVLQHPDREWNTFAARFENATGKPVVFFTTYKILTGSMFRNMTKKLGSRTGEPFAKMKSRNGSLSEKDKATLDMFVS